MLAAAAAAAAAIDAPSPNRTTMRNKRTHAKTLVEFTVMFHEGIFFECTTMRRLQLNQLN